MLKYYLTGIVILFTFYYQAFSQCSPAPNDSCINAISLLVNGGLIPGTTCGSTIEAGELTDCADSGTNQSVWYKFTAIGGLMDVTVNATGSCYLSSAVWGPVVSCPVASGCHPISCQSAQNGPTTTDHVLNGLSVGSVYYVQVLFKTDTLSCGSGGLFTVGVSTTVDSMASNPAPLSSCANPGGSVCVFNRNPTTQEVTQSCTAYNIPSSDAGTNNVVSACYSFVNQNSPDINFNIIINYNAICSPTPGNVTWLDWTLYNGDCTVFDCGNYGNMSSMGLVCGNNYELCYSYEIPDCEVDMQVYPYIVAIPEAISITASSDSICRKDSVALMANAFSYISYQWMPSAGLNISTGDTVTATPLLTTTYSAIGTDVYGCIDTGSTVIQVAYCGPSAGFAFTDSACKTDCVTYTDSSSASATSWQWSFAGGSPSTFNGSSPPPVCYNAQGTYTTQLVVSNYYGSDTLIKTINIKDCSPKAGLTPAFDTVCATRCINFTNTSVGATSWQWVFLGGTPSSYSGENPPTICYNDSGHFIVRLTVTNNYGSNTFLTAAIVRNCMLPVADFSSPDTLCLYDCYLYSDYSSGNATSWQWTFGGGKPISFSGENPPPVCYDTAGVFQTMLIVSNSHGQDTAIENVVITDCSSFASFTLSDSDICNNDCITITNTSSANTTSWQWRFLGGSPSEYNGRTPPPVCFNTEGNYTMQLIAGNKYGTATIDHHVEVSNCEPVADFVANDSVICENDCIGFTNLSSINSTSWQWNFPGGNPSSYSGQIPPFICYDLAGHYDVILVAGNNNGSDTLYHPDYIIVQDGPDLHIMQESDTLICSFASSYQWSYNGANIPGATSSSYIAAQYGLYVVQATNGSGCSGADSIEYIGTNADKLTADDAIIISPNPTKGVFNIITPYSLIDGEIEVYNTLGEKLVDTKLKMKNSRSFAIDLSSQPDGVYYVRVETGNGTYIRKVVVGR